MFLVKIIIWYSVFISVLIGQKFELSSGFYQNSTKEDSIEVLVIDENKVDLKLSDGSKLRFNLESDIFKMKNLSNDGYTGLRLIYDTKFEMFYGHNQKATNSGFDTYEIYQKPGVLNKIIAFLVTSALFISIFQFYLKLNKVWKRRGIAEVANSISIVAALLGFGVGFPFLLNCLFILSLIHI